MTVHFVTKVQVVVIRVHPPWHPLVTAGRILAVRLAAGLHRPVLIFVDLCATVLER